MCSVNTQWVFGECEWVALAVAVVTQNCSSCGGGIRGGNKEDMTPFSGALSVPGACQCGMDSTGVTAVE